MAANYRLRPGCSHYLGGGRDVRPGEVVTLTDTQARAFGDKFELLESEAAKQDPANPPEQKPSHLEVRHKGGGWYDVVNTATGQKINSTALNYTQANSMVEEV